MVMSALAEKSMWKTLKVAQAANHHDIALCSEEMGTTGSNPVRALHYGAHLCILQQMQQAIVNQPFYRWHT
jgi:hypothetical protein